MKYYVLGAFGRACCMALLAAVAQFWLLRRIDM
jgi:hypothetical protein